MELICVALQLYVIVIFVRVILSWFPITPGSAMESVDTFMRMLTEPVLGPLRRAIPALRMGGMAIDLSPMIVMFVIYLVLVPLVCTG